MRRNLVLVGRSLLSLAVLMIALALLANPISGEGSPNADFDVNSHRIVESDQYIWKTYVGEEIVLSAGSSTDASTYRWDLGDGSSRESDISTLSHTYEYIGEYIVILEVEDDEGNTDAKAGHILIIDRPQTHLVLRDAVTSEIIDPDQTSVLAGHDVIFDASSSGGELMTYQFGFDLERVFVPQSLVMSPYFRHSYSTPGEYKIGLRVVDSLGNRSQMDSEEFIEIKVVDPLTIAGEGDSEPTPLVGNLVGVLLFISVIGVFVIAFRKKSDPGHSWGSSVKDPKGHSEDEQSPFYFKNVRDTRIMDPVRTPAQRANPSKYESTITDSMPLSQSTFSDFQKQ